MIGQQELQLIIRRDFAPAPERPTPVLWVEDLRVYREFNQDAQQCRYELRPGLNILWADPGPVDSKLYGRGVPGHAAGKTTFCRLLRYLVGEPTFGTEAFQNAIIAWKPNPMLLGKVWVDGVSWIVCRPLGNDPRDFAFRGTAIEEAFVKEETAIPYSEFLTELAKIIETPLTATKLSHGHQLTWRYILPWLTRDQECRLAHLLEWRDPTTESQRPDMTQADACYILRSVMGLITQKEEDAVDKHRILLETKADTDARLPLLQHHAKEGVKEVTEWADNPTLKHDLLFADAKASLDRRITSIKNNADVARANATKEALGRSIASFEKEISASDALLQEKIELLEEDRLTLAVLEGKEVNEKARTEMNGDDPAPSGRCNVPLEVAKAKGCSLARGRRYDFESHKNLKAFTDGDAAEVYRRFIESTEKAIAEQQADLQRRQAELIQMRTAQSDAQTEYDTLLANVNEKVGELRASQRRLPTIKEKHDEADRLRRLQKTTNADLKRSTKTQNELRQQASEKLSRVNELYEDLIQAILGDDVSASFVSQAQDIILKVDCHGDRTSSATETVKILCLDIAAMLLSAEGHGHHPRFLVHDSPREADMAPGTYQRFFIYMRELEKAFGDTQPNFQHIITTTEPPPEDLQLKPWLIAKLNASEESKRILKVNL